MIWIIGQVDTRTFTPLFACRAAVSIDADVVSGTSGVTLSTVFDVFVEVYAFLGTFAPTLR